MNNEIEINTYVEFKSCELNDSPYVGYNNVDVIFKMPAKELLSSKIIIIAEDITGLLDDDIIESEESMERFYKKEYFLGLYDFCKYGILRFSSPITNEYYHTALPSYIREAESLINYFYSFVSKQSFLDIIGESKICFYVSYISFLKYNSSYFNILNLLHNNKIEKNAAYATIFVNEDDLEIDYNNNEYRLYVSSPKGDIILCKATDGDISDLTSKMTFDQKMRFISMIK